MSFPKNYANLNTHLIVKFYKWINSNLLAKPLCIFNLRVFLFYCLIFEGLVKLVGEAVKHEHALSPNKPIYLVGDSFGGCLALAVAARNPAVDLVLILSNPGDSINGVFFFVKFVSVFSWWYLVNFQLKSGIIPFSNHSYILWPISVATFVSYLGGFTWRTACCCSLCSELYYG